MSRPSGFSRAEIDGHLRELRDEVPSRVLFDGPRRYALSVQVPGEWHRRRIESEAEWRRVAPRITNVEKR